MEGVIDCAITGGNDDAWNFIPACFDNILGKSLFDQGHRVWDNVAMDGHYIAISASDSLLTLGEAKGL